MSPTEPASISIFLVGLLLVASLFLFVWPFYLLFLFFFFVVELCLSFLLLLPGLHCEINHRSRFDCSRGFDWFSSVPSSSDDASEMLFDANWMLVSRLTSTRFPMVVALIRWRRRWRRWGRKRKRIVQHGSRHAHRVLGFC